MSAAIRIDPAVAGHAACSGCALCLLVCPVWRQTRDVELTPLGASKALQYGATTEAGGQVAAMAACCNLCGACAAVCPERIDLAASLRALRRHLQLPASEPDPAPPRALLPAVRRHLRPGDLLVIAADAFHADYEARVPAYDQLRRDTGCQLNLDLQRIAIPARLPLPAQYRNAADDLDQARWIVQDRSIRRIVVEDPADREVFVRLGTWPVLTVTELEKETS